MSEKFLVPQMIAPEVKPSQEAMAKLKELLAEAEKVFEAEGREIAKPYLGKIYKALKELNKTSPDELSFVWHQEGDMTEDEFNALNLRRKLLSNAIGIMTASGEVRHDVCKI